MPRVEVNGAQLYYEVHGDGAETIVFSHGLLWSGKMFEKQVEALQSKYRCVVYDHRGQGQSYVPSSGYDMETVYQDAVELIKALDLAPCHFAGLSMGGFVAMRIAARNPQLIKSLILMETSSDGEPFKFKYNLLNTIVKLFGVSAVTNKVMPIMFGQKFLNDSNRKEEYEIWKGHLQANKKTIVRAVGGVISREPVFQELQNITVPTLVIVGDQDIATIPEKSERICSQIPQAQFVKIIGAGHSSSIEEPEQVNKAILKFLHSLNAKV